MNTTTWGGDGFYDLRAVTIDVAGVVSMGKTVTVQEKGEDPETFMLVGAKEADPRAGRISNESPLGKALLGGLDSLPC